MADNLDGIPPGPSPQQAEVTQGPGDGSVWGSACKSRQPTPAQDQGGNGKDSWEKEQQVAQQNKRELMQLRVSATLRQRTEMLQSQAVTSVDQSATVVSEGILHSDMGPANDDSQGAAGAADGDEREDRPASAEIRDYLLKTLRQAAQVSPEESLREHIRRIDEQLEAVEKQTAMPPRQQAQRLRGLRVQRQASLSELTQMQIQNAAAKVEDSMQAFQDHIFEHASQWAGVEDIPKQLAKALRTFPSYQLAMNELVGVEVHDVHNRALLKNILHKFQHRMETIVDELHYHVWHSDKALDVEMERMRATIHHLQKVTAEDRRPSSSRRKQAAEMATKLKSDMQQLSELVTSAARVIGWLEFDLDDPKGRSEYVGQLLRQDGEEEGVEDGLGCMHWRDGSSYAGEFRTGYLDGFGHETYGDGSTFKGQFANDKRHGLGVFSLASGQRYCGAWREGERHGLGLHSTPSSGHVAYELVRFVDGELKERVEDESRMEALGCEIADVTRDAMEMAALARQLAPDIQRRTAEFHEQESIRKSIQQSFGAALLGPRQSEVEASAGPQDPAAETRTRPAKPHDSLGAWLDFINLFGASADDPSIRAQIQKVANAIHTAGYEAPAKLLCLLSDVDAYDSFADAIGLKAKQARLLWKGLEDLEVVLTPRSLGRLTPRKGPQKFEVDTERMAYLQRHFQKFCDKSDEHGQPRMGISGLHKALVDMNIAHEFAQLQEILSRIDTNRDGHIDLDEFTGAVLDIEKAQWLAVQERTRREALEAEQKRVEDDRRRKAAKLAAQRAEERAIIEAEERARVEQEDAERRQREEEDRRRLEAEMAAKSEAERKEAQRKKAETEERKRQADAIAEEERKKREAMEEEERRRIEAQERAEKEERERRWVEEMFRRTVAAGCLQYALRRALARVALTVQVHLRVHGARSLEAFTRRKHALEWYAGRRISIRVLQGSLRKVVRVVSLHTSSTLAAAWQEIQPANEEVIQIHRRISRRVNEEESGGGDCFLNGLLNTRFSASSRLSPGDVIIFLKAVDEERAFQSAAELEIATLAAASNVMFRLYVRRKAKAIRQRLFEKRAKILEAERERERGLAERRALEARRMREWLAAENYAVREKAKLEAERRKAEESAKKMAACAAQEIAIKERARDRARLRKAREDQRRQEQEQITATRRMAELRKHQAESATSIDIKLEHRMQRTPLRQRMSVILARMWNESINVSESRSLIGQVKPPWDGDIADCRRDQKPTRLAPLQASSPSSSKRLDRWPLTAKSSASGNLTRVKSPRRNSAIPPSPAALLSLQEDSIIPQLQAPGAVNVHAPLSHKLDPIQDYKVSHPARAALWQTRVKTPQLRAGALSTSAWDDAHPHAAVRPRTSVRRLMLVQAEIRLRHIRRMEARAVLRRQGLISDGKETDDELAPLPGRHDYVAAYLEEWERKMQAISLLQDQDDGGREFLACGTHACGTLKGSSWLNVPNRVAARLAIAPGQRPGSSRRAPSLSFSILARKV